MGKIDYFEIIIDKPIFFSGETLTGRVIIICKERVSIESIYVNFLGTGRVYWSERIQTAKSNNKVTIVDYENNEIYLNKQMVFVAKRGKNDLFLEIGKTIYPFEMELPKNLPTSFHHKRGRIFYRVRATIEISNSKETEIEKAFSVIQHYDLNLNLSARQATGATGQKTVCCGPCSSDPVIAKISIKKTGFVSGESIKFQVTIQNKSDKPLKLLAVKLIQQSEFRGRSEDGVPDCQRYKQRYENREIAAVAYEPEVPNETWDGSLKIPPVCATANAAMSSCKIIGISYFLVLNFDVKTISWSKDLDVPIIIGTICLREKEDVTTKYDSDNSDEIPMPVIPKLTYKTALDYDYNDRFAKNLDKNDQIHEGDKFPEIGAEIGFKPLYPYYNFDEKY